jgi:hypothetical protein
MKLKPRALNQRGENNKNIKSDGKIYFGLLQQINILTAKVINTTPEYDFIPGLKAKQRAGKVSQARNKLSDLIRILIKPNFSKTQ